MRILHVEDETLFRQALAGILRQQPDVGDLAEASCGREALTRFRAFRPNVTLVDLQLKNDPDSLDGEDVIRELLSDFPDARIIVVSRYFGVERVRWALDAGAQSFVPKGMEPRALFDVMRSVHAGTPLIPPQLLTRARAVPKEKWLTRKQYQVLLLLERGLTHEEIGDNLDPPIGSLGVKTHVREIYQRVNANNPHDAIINALEGREPL
jgi:DNA-binding NarL/FixJ family response regulator